jgi:hypothetical protein
LIAVMQKRLLGLGLEKKAGMPTARIDCPGICRMIPINGFHQDLHAQACPNNPEVETSIRTIVFEKGAIKNLAAEASGTKP